MGVVAARAGKLPAGTGRVGLAGNRMIAQPVAGHDVPARTHLVMAHDAEVRQGAGKIELRVRAVGAVARRTISCGDRRMDVLFREHPLVVTGKTKVRRRRGQELFLLRRMDGMAGGAHPSSHGRVLELLIEHPAVVTVETEVRRRGDQGKLRLLGLVGRCVAGFAPHAERGMDHLPCLDGGMAINA